jgi:AcrR family transcriptional regulator
MERTKVPSDARRRILDTADRLFYAEGVRAVGIDRILAESGAAKMTLYSHFGSKDDLILAVLQHREEQFTSWFSEAMERHVGAGKDRLGALFGALKEWFETPTFRGCAFINAAIELADVGHPGFAFAQQHKERFQAFLAKLIEETLGKAAAELAPAVAVLIEGAIVTAVIQGSSRPAEVARDAAFRLVAPRKGS